MSFHTRCLETVGLEHALVARGQAASPISVDVFANYNDPSIAEAVTAVLHHNGIEVYVPPGQSGCGMAALTYGDVETAREAVQHNAVHLLADLAREGWPILCSGTDRRGNAAPKTPST